MNKRIIIVLIMSAAWSPAVFAQTRKAAAQDTIRTNTIEVIQSYRPELKQSPKPEFVPEMPPSDTSGSRLSYDVPVQTLYFTYHSQPLKPLALGRDTVSTPFANYVKLGGGNLSTLYLDAGAGSLRGENYETDIHLHHLSQKGNVRFQESMLSGLEAKGTLHTAGHAWTGSLDLMRNRFYRYGYDHTLPGYEPPSLTLGGARIRAGAQNERENQWGILYKPLIDVSFFTGSMIGNEQQISLQAPFSKKIDSVVTAHFGILAGYTRLDAGSTVSDAGILGLSPGLSFHKGILRGHAFLSPTFGNGGNAYLLPDLAVSARVPNSHFDLQGGWKASLVQNSYERFFLRNPFIGTGPENTAADILSQSRTDEVYGGLQSNLGDHISFSGRVSWWELRNMPLFLNSRADRSVFDLIHDPEVNALSLNAHIRYQIANTFALGLSGTWFNYYQSHVTHVWHEPGVQWKADFLFRPIPALTITAYALVLDQIYATDIASRAIKLKAVTDLGCGGEYSLIPRISVFLRVNNLLNNRYQRWEGYPSYGFNIFGGLQVKF